MCYWTTSDVLFEDFVSWDEAQKYANNYFKTSNNNVYIFEVRKFDKPNNVIYRVCNKDYLVTMDDSTVELIKTYRV